MADYKRMYTKLFNAYTDASRLLTKAIELMKKAQLESENIFVQTDDYFIEKYSEEQSDP